MQIKDFQTVFQRYFHGKYSYNDFLNYSPIINENIFVNTYANHTTYSYKLDDNNSLKLKNFHTFLNNIIFIKQKIHDNVFSYRENHTILQMVTLHKNSKYYFKTDIKNFFGSISKKMISDCIITNLQNIPLDNILNLITIDNKLPAGFVSSPAISNFVLYNFDVEINKYCKENNIIYTRYSDDLIFSSNTQIFNIENTIQDILKNLYDNKFILNSSKSKYMNKSNRIKILGLIITPNGYITIPKNEKDNMKKLLHFYVTNKDKFDKLLNDKYDNKLSKAYGKLNYINDVNIDYVNYLRKKYGNFVIDSFLHGKK